MNTIHSNEDIKIRIIFLKKVFVVLKCTKNKLLWNSLFVKSQRAPLAGSRFELKCKTLPAIRIPKQKAQKSRFTGGAGVPGSSSNQAEMCAWTVGRTGRIRSEHPPDRPTRSRAA